MKKQLFILICILLTIHLKSVNYFWIGGAGNWSDINHWATTSGGSTLHSFVPTPNDDVFFDTGSGFTAGSKIVTVNTNATCRNMTWSGTLNNPQLTGPSGSVLNVYGSMTLQSGMLYTLQDINFMSTTIGETITTNSVVLGGSGSVSFGGSGSWIVQDAIMATAKRVFLNSGTLNTNNQKLDIGQFISTTTTLRTLSLGTSTITLNQAGVTGIPYQWEVDGSNITISPSLSTIVLNVSPYNYFTSTIPNLVYGNVIFNFLGNLTCGNGTTFNAVSFNDDGNINSSVKIGTLNFSAGNVYSFYSSGTCTITSAFNAHPVVCTGWISITASNPGTQFNLSMPATATVNVANCTIQNSNVIGGAAFTASNSVSEGNNTGWTFLAPVVSDLYWRGGSGNWEDGNHWSFFPSGPPSGCIPDPVTNAIFDASSGLTAGNDVITISTVQNCRNLTCAGSAIAPKISSPSANTGNLNIYGSVILQSGMSYNVLTNFKSTGAETIQSNGVAFNAPDFNGVLFNGTGSFTLNDDFRVLQRMQLIRGTLNTNNQNCFWNAFSDFGSFPMALKNLNLGSSVINMSADWSYENGNLNAGTSHIIMNNIGYFTARYTPFTHTYYDVTFTGVGYLFGGNKTAFHNVVFNSNANVGSTFNDGYLYNNLTFSPNTTCNLSASYSNTITGVFTATVAPCGGWITMNGGTINMSAIATVNVSRVIMQDVNAIGGAVFTASNSVDVSGNTGWTFGAVVVNNLYWVGGSGNWNDATHWSTINNGVYPSVSPCVPGPSDNVFFNANSGLISSSRTVSITASVYCRNITCVGSATAPSFIGTSIGYLNIYGSTIMQAGGNYQVSFVFKSSSAETITSNGITFSQSGSNEVRFDGTGSWSLLDDFRTNALYLYLRQGTFSTNNHDVYCASFVDRPTSGSALPLVTRHLNLGSSRIFISGAFNLFGVPWEFLQSNSTINSGTSHIIITNTNATTEFRTNSSQTYYDVTFNGPGGYTITGSGSNFHNVIFLINGGMNGNHVFNELTFTGRYTYLLQTGFTQTVTSNFYPSGNPCFITFIRSTSAGTRGNINVQAGSVNYDYVDIKDIDATPSFATFNIDGHSANNGNNLNMIFAPTTTVGLTGLGADITLCQSALPITLNTTSFFPNPVTTFSWTGGITTNTLSVTTGGSYSVAVKYAADCIVNDAIVVTANPTPTIVISGNAVTCNGAATILTASGASTYTWTSPTVTTNTVSVNPVSNTTYSVVGTSTAGCVSAQSVITVTVSSSPTVAISSVSSPTICSGNSTTITPSGASTYTLTSSTQTLIAFPFVVSPGSTTTYTLRGTGSSCLSGNSLQQIITVNTTPTVAISSVSSPTICSGNSTTITPSGASTYTLTSSTQTLTAAPFVVSPGSTTTYTLIGTGSSCLSGNSLQQTITVNTTPTVAISSVSSPTICSGNSTTITPSGASTYTLTSSTQTLTAFPFVVSPSSTTTYTLIGTGSSCLSGNSLQQIITVNTTPTVVISSVSSPTICSGNSTTITPSGASTYTLTSSTQTLTVFPFVVSPSSTTTYTLIGTGSSCLSGNSLQQIITVNTTPTVAISSVSSPTICSGNSTTITPIGASTYSLTSSTQTLTTAPFVVSPGSTTTYTLRGTGSSCLSGNSLQQIITVNTTPTVAISSVSSPTICSGNSTTITPSGTSTYTLTSSTQTLTAAPFVVSPGSTTTYTLRGTSSGCLSGNNIQQVITVNTTPTVAITSVSSPTICSGNSTTITPSGASTYTLTSSTQTLTAAPFVVSPGSTTTYTLRGTSSSCLSGNSLQQTITVNTTPTVAISSVSSPTICSGNSTTITPSGASTYTLTSSTQTLTATPFVVSPGSTTTYTLRGTSSSCLSGNSLQQIITVNTTPTVAISSVSSPTICSGNSTTITPSGASTYTLTSSTQTLTIAPFVVSPGSTTTYTLRGTSSSNCPSGNNLQQIISVNTLPVLSVSSQTNVSCFGLSNGGVTLLTSGGFGSNYSITPTTTVNLSSGTYTYVLVDGNSCSASTVVTISQPTAALMSSISGTVANSNCIIANGEATVTISGGTPGYTVTWDNGSVGQTVSTLNTGTHTFVVLDANDCINNAGMVTISGVTGITTNAVSQTSINCFGASTGAITFSTSGGSTYSYTLTGSSANYTTTTGLFTNLSADTYSLQVVDNVSGCTDSKVVTLSSPSSSVTLSSIITTSILCNGGVGTASVTITGGTPNYSYSWSSNTSTINSATYTAGTYSLDIHDANNCNLMTHTFVIAEPQPLMVMFTNTIQAGCGLSNGQATVNTTGGNPTYLYTWTTPVTSYTTTGVTTNSLSVGINSLTATDGNGCTTSTLITITNPNSPTVTTTVSDVKCFGGMTGIISSSVTGTSPYIYNWSDGSNAPDLMNVAVGDYTLIVIDANNCTASHTATISQPSLALSLGANNVVNVSCVGASNGSAQVLANGGTPNYTYTWIPGNINGANVNNLSVGNYTVSVTDNNGCITNTFVAIANSGSGLLQATLISSEQPTCQQNNGLISIDISGGTPQYTYQWSPLNSTSATLNNAPAGNYSVIVTDADGCKDTLHITLDCKIDIFIPEIFSPNGDGQNEKFEIKGIANYPGNTVNIFNRWGALVYTKKEYNNEWDGKANVGDATGTAMLPSGTYYIVIDFGDGGKTKTYTGYLQLAY